MRLGWIGTGILGSAILQRLAPHFQIMAWNRTSQKVDALTGSGIQKAQTLRELTEQSEMIFLCVKGEEVYEEILFDLETGIVSRLKPNTLIVDTSTLSPDTSIQLAQRLRSLGFRYVECPVSGGPEGALLGRLTGLIAGERQDVKEARPVVERFCSSIHEVGPIGQAQLLKVLNNLAESINLLGAAEVIQMGIQSGIDVRVLRDVFQTTRGYSVYMGVLFDRLLHPSADASATLDVRLKDVRLANQLASKHDWPAPMGKLTKALFEKAIEQCGAEADQTDCIHLFQPQRK